MNVSVIPYCTAALLGHAKAEGKPASINYKIGKGDNSLVKTLTVSPEYSCKVTYGNVTVLRKNDSGRWITLARIPCRSIHSLTDHTGIMMPFTEEQRGGGGRFMPAGARSFNVRV